jgi:hypothetical protein
LKFCNGQKEQAIRHLTSNENIKAASKPLLKQAMAAGKNVIEAASYGAWKEVIILKERFLVC